MIIEGVDYFVRMVDFPVGAGCNGMVILNDDDTYSVYINARTSADEQKKAMRHEYNHMINGDLYGDKNICDCEAALSA